MRESTDLVERAGPRERTDRSERAVIAESTAYCRASGRLMWVVLDWLIRHIDEIDEQKLMQQNG